MTGSEHETLDVLRTLLNGFLALGLIGGSILVVCGFLWLADWMARNKPLF